MSALHGDIHIKPEWDMGYLRECMELWDDPNGGEPIETDDVECMYIAYKDEVRLGVITVCVVDGHYVLGGFRDTRIPVTVWEYVAIFKHVTKIYEGVYIIVGENDRYAKILCRKFKFYDMGEFRGDKLFKIEG